MFTSLICSLLFSQVAPTQELHEVRLRVEVGNTRLMDGRDPIFVKVYIKNVGLRPIPLSQAFACEEGTIAFEVQDVDRSMPVRRLYSLQHGLSAGFVRDKNRLECAAGTTVVTYGVITTDFEVPPVFSKPGKFVIRAIVLDVPNVKYTSESEEMEIVSTVRGDARKVMEARELLVDAMVSSLVDSKAILEASVEVGGTSLLDTVAWTTPLARLHEASTEAEVRSSLGNIKQVQKTLSPVCAEFVAWRTATILHGVNRHFLANEYIKQVDARSYERGQLTELIDMKL